MENGNHVMHESDSELVLDMTLRVGAVRKIKFYFCLPLDENRDRVLN